MVKKFRTLIFVTGTVPFLGGSFGRIIPWYISIVELNWYYCTLFPYSIYEEVSVGGIIGNINIKDNCRILWSIGDSRIILVIILLDISDRDISKGGNESKIPSQTNPPPFRDQYYNHFDGKNLNPLPKVNCEDGKVVGMRTLHLGGWGYQWWHNLCICR